MSGAEDDKPDGRPPRVWVLAGHKAGDNAQLMALAGALKWPVEVKRLAYRASELSTNLLLRVTLAGLAKGRIVVSLPGSEHAVRLAMDRLLIPELGHLVQQASR